MAIVRHTLETLPPVSKKDLDRVDAIRDEDIDYSDIPEITDFSKFRPWEHRQMFKPVKVAVTCKLDADVVAWLKQNGKGYQTRMNAILRQVMVQAQ
ncbi:MAG: BrnA antitoxin family protein [Treponema sp.]|nr:BrnA antitoxin family protein [Treponema sp.]